MCYVNERARAQSAAVRSSFKSWLTQVLPLREWTGGHPRHIAGDDEDGTGLKPRVQHNGADMEMLRDNIDML